MSAVPGHIQLAASSSGNAPNSHINRNTPNNAEVSSHSHSLSPLEPLSHALSRDSRISLPDEARQYIANMVDSPAGSPQPGASFTHRPHPPSSLSRIHEAEEHRTPNHPTPQGTNGQAAASSSSVGSEFLDLDGEDEDDNTVDSVIESRNALDPPGDEYDLDRKDSLVDKIDKHAVVDDFPLPPTSASQRANLSPATETDASLAERSDSPQTFASSSSSLQHNPNLTKARPSESYTASSNLSFRALPLLAADLARTNVQVISSSVRPNDRGKDVVSFVALVSPGNSKEPWRIEKLYPDVLSLDHRIRSLAGRNASKKIGNLPEPKLWRDHAPAKVDQRKAALETYLYSLVHLPIKDTHEIIAFLTSDIVREAHKPVMQPGHKEGYLTKRGKNFGGWKSRFFVLQGPVLEYYESRGGAHLGSINVTGAQIGRQQKTTDKTPSADDDKEFRHAFLIVEAKKGPSGNHARHVLCAESDAERDNWVDMLVRYFTGAYEEEASSVGSSPSTPRKAPTRNLSKDNIQLTKGSGPPLPQVQSDGNSAKFLASGVGSSNERGSSPSDPSSASETERTHKHDLVPPPRESLDAGSPASEFRANSSLSHYNEQEDVDRRLTSIDAERSKASAEPLQSVPERGESPEKLESRSKISRPINGAPIPSGFKFGAKDTHEASPSPSDRREKAKSRSFWGFGKPSDKPNSPAVYVPRAVFNISLEDSLSVAQVAGLPAIVFRCIKYLESKKADQEEGIYRLSGSSAVIKSLRDRFNSEGDLDLLASDEYWDLHAIAGLLKSYLRELPTSILTRDLHLRFLAVIDFSDSQERIKELSQLIASLPIANYTLLRALTAHLILIVQNANVNKMTMRNVGIVFSPTLGIPAGVFSLMLGEFNRVFNVNESGSMDESVAGGAVPVIRRNSKQYSEAAADELLGISGRTLPVTTEEGHSDTDGLSNNEERRVDTSEDQGVDSSNTSPPASSHQHLGVPNTPTGPSAQSSSKAQNAAASRGLNIATGARTNHQGRPIGLPSSPRPPHTPDTPPQNPSTVSSAGYC